VSEITMTSTTRERRIKRQFLVTIDYLERGIPITAEMIEVAIENTGIITDDETIGVIETTPKGDH